MPIHSRDKSLSLNFCFIKGYPLYCVYDEINLFISRPNKVFDPTRWEGNESKFIIRFKTTTGLRLVTNQGHVQEQDGHILQ